MEEWHFFKKDKTEHCFSCSRGPYLCFQHYFWEEPAAWMWLPQIYRNFRISSSKAWNWRGTMQICHVSTEHSTELDSYSACFKHNHIHGHIYYLYTLVLLGHSSYVVEKKPTSYLIKSWEQHVITLTLTLLCYSNRNVDTRAMWH